MCLFRETFVEQHCASGNQLSNIAGVEGIAVGIVTEMDYTDTGSNGAGTEFM